MEVSLALCFLLDVTRRLALKADDIKDQSASATRAPVKRGSWPDADQEHQEQIASIPHLVRA